MEAYIRVLRHLNRIGFMVAVVGTAVGLVWEGIKWIAGLFR